jgi:hypothetical protein
MKFLYFFLLVWVIFALLDPDPDFETQTGTAFKFSVLWKYLSQSTSCFSIREAISSIFLCLKFCWCLLQIWQARFDEMDLPYSTGTYFTVFSRGRTGPIPRQNELEIQMYF